MILSPKSTEAAVGVSLFSYEKNEGMWTLGMTLVIQ
jgi:hypothetical protein